MKIFCPHCEYQPLAADRWQCRPGCFTIWNTFETHACCPGCAKQWRLTWCPGCGRYSPHDDWYHDDVPDESIAETERDVELVGA